MSDEEYDLDYSEAEDDQAMDVTPSNQIDNNSQLSDNCESDNEPEYEASLLESMSEEMNAEPELEPALNHQRLGLCQIVDLMNKALREVTEVVDLPSDQIRILLNHVNWDKNRLLEQYFENRDKLLADAHIIDPNLELRKLKRRRKLELCLICYDEVSPKDMTSISCGHEFCIGKSY